jgi:AcrR family transcriptional regulator
VQHKASDYPAASNSPSTTCGRKGRREDIVRIATQLFATRGFHGTRVSDLADGVGLNKATLYYYYPSKALLLYEIYRRAASATLAAVEPGTDRSPKDALHECISNLMRIVAADADAAAVYAQEGPYIGEWFTAEQLSEVRRVETVVCERIRDIIERGVAVGEFHSCDSHLLASGYLGLTLDSHRWLQLGSRESADRIANEISRTLLRGLSRHDDGETHA